MTNGQNTASSETKEIEIRNGSNVIKINDNGIIINLESGTLRFLNQ